MSRFFISQILFLLVCATNVSAQNVVDFAITTPSVKVTGGLYHKLSYLDSRPDTTDLGFVQTGFFNRRASVITKKPLSVQLDKIFASLVDTTMGHEEMLFQLRQFGFAEITAGMSERGFCFIRAGLYANKSGQYQKILTIDTVMILSSSIDVTQALLKAGRDTLPRFIASGLIHEPAGPLYSLHDLMNIDSVEKSNIKLYNTNAYADGVYLSYRSFMNQAPDKQIIFDGPDVTSGTIKTTGENGKPQRVRAQKVYAIVYKGQPYVSCRGQYCLLKKEKGEFYFIGRSQVSPGAGEVVAVALVGALFGSIIIANSAEATFQMQIDHLNGGFIRLKQIQVPSALDYHPDQQPTE
jgi:hypothetical protein